MKTAKFFLVVLFFIFGARAQSREIMVFANESMPQSGTVDGRPAGMAVDILNAVTAEGGPIFKFNFSMPWARALIAIHKATDTAIIPLTRIPERESDFKWIGNLFEDAGRLVSVGRVAPIQTLDEARGLSIGVMRGSSYETMLKQLGFSHVEVVQSDALNARMLAAGRFDAWAGSEVVQRYLFAKVGEDVSKLQRGPRLGDPQQIYIAADPKFPEADAKAIAEGLKKVRSSGKLEEILKKYR
jgi:polar amino acid transport system substrate-binding protein